jgi:hypothetical protein
VSEFELEEKQSDGATLRDHLKAVWLSKGVMPEQLRKAANPPEHAIHVWNHFLELHKERPDNGFGAGRLTASIIKDWCQLYCVELELWEVKAINKIDNAWIRLQSEKRKDD